MPRAEECPGGTPGMPRRQFIGGALGGPRVPRAELFLAVDRLANCTQFAIKGAASWWHI